MVDSEPTVGVKPQDTITEQVGFDVTFPSVFMLSPNPFFCSGEIRLKGVASPQCIQPVQEAGLGWWELPKRQAAFRSRELGGFSPLIPLPALRQFLHPCAHPTLPRFQIETSLFLDPA